jgi:hypothetical protein
LTSAEGEKHLRAFDNEWISFFKQASETNAYLAFNALTSIDNAPLPLRLYPDSTGNKSLYFPFDSLTGVYLYDTIANQFVKKNESDSVVLFYPFGEHGSRMAKFIIAEYHEEPSVWGVLLPTKVDIKLEEANKTLLSLRSTTKMQYQVPVHSSTHIEFDRFDGIFELKTKLSRNRSKISLSGIVSAIMLQFFRVKARFGLR